MNWRSLILVMVVAALAGCARSAMPPRPDRSLPNAVDFSAVDAFWRVQALLSADREPAADEWQRLLATPGYRLARRAYGDVLEEDLRVALQPSRRAVFDSVTKLGRARALRLMHLREAAARRPQLRSFRDSVVRSTLAVRAVALASRYLPPGATDGADPPVVVFAIFADDGYSFGDSVLVDLLHASRSDLTLFLAHEFHHTYVERLARGQDSASDRPADRDLRSAFENLRKEGIADLIDKAYPFVSTSPALASYAQRYNEEYARTPATLALLDSLLRGATDDSASMADVGKRVRSLLWSGGHANGAYMARKILDTFGVDSLFPGEADPAAFIRTYNAAEVARHRGPALSAPAMRILELLKRQYWSGAPFTSGGGSVQRPR